MKPEPNPTEPKTTHEHTNGATPITASPPAPPAAPEPPQNTQITLTSPPPQTVWKATPSMLSSPPSP